jgi:ATP-dependent exoDNAse (exonuclease V) alpha subunit
LQVANRDLGIIQHIGDDGKISVRIDGVKDRIVRFDVEQRRHFDHGYAVTSHSSQGLTSERVLVNMDTGVHPELVNSRFAYVSVSRASHDAQIFTNDASTLADRLSRDISKASAINFEKRDNPVAVIALGHAKASGATSAFGLGLAP